MIVTVKLTSLSRDSKTRGIFAAKTRYSGTYNGTTQTWDLTGVTEAELDSGELSGWNLTVLYVTGRPVVTVAEVAPVELAPAAPVEAVTAAPATDREIAAYVQDRTGVYMTPSMPRYVAKRVRTSGRPVTAWAQVELDDLAQDASMTANYSH